MLKIRQIWVVGKSKDEDYKDNEESGNVDDKANLGVVSNCRDEGDKDNEDGGNVDHKANLWENKVTVESSTDVEDEALKLLKR